VWRQLAAVDRVAAGTVGGMAKRWGRRGRQLLMVLHYVTSVGWLGVGLCQLTLNLVALTTADPLMRHHVHEINHVLDRQLLTVLALGAAATGVLLAWRSTWGLLRHWWIVVKLIITAALLVFLPVWMGGWASQAIAATTPAGPDPAYLTILADLIAGSLSVLVTLVAVVAISLTKPWGRIHRGRRAQLARRQQHQATKATAGWA
jgi:hypothetical protein